MQTLSTQLVMLATISGIALLGGAFYFARNAGAHRITDSIKQRRRKEGLWLITAFLLILAGAAVLASTAQELHHRAQTISFIFLVLFSGLMLAGLAGTLRVKTTIERVEELDDCQTVVEELDRLGNKLAVRIGLTVISAIVVLTTVLRA